MVEQRDDHNIRMRRFTGVRYSVRSGHDRLVERTTEVESMAGLYDTMRDTLDQCEATVGARGVHGLQESALENDDA
jgi:hypothetical protein